MMRSVFLSRPTRVTDDQATFCEALAKRIREQDFEPQTVGVNQFSNDAPLMTVRNLMESCHGAVVLGLSQLHVTTGVRRPGTTGAQRVRSLQLPTPWNQLEAGIAFALDLPILIVNEQGVEPDGIFDPAIGDRFVHQTDLSLDWLDADAFVQPFMEWVHEVRSR